jgi:glycosyltransferase involved in cell wall biosynthesis
VTETTAESSEAAAAPRTRLDAAVRQRLCLVLPSTGEFDSRTFRIASAAAARGHEVTVVARLGAGLPAEEMHPAGYRIIRVPVAAVDGLPMQSLVRLIRRVGRIFYGWRARKGMEAVSAPAAGGIESLQNGQDDGDAIPSELRDRRVHSAPSEGFRDIPSRLVRYRRKVVALPRTAAVTLVRRLAIPLTIRSQRIQAEQHAPDADLYHGMAYMGIPVALALGRRQGGRVVYDARDIYVDAANLARMSRPARWLIGRAERRWARSADRVITVNRPYAEVMAARWDIELPLIVMNCSYRYRVPDPRPRRFHSELGLSPDQRVVLYQGGFSPDRGIEQLMEAILAIPNAVLVLLGYGVLRPALEAQVGEPPYRGRVRMLPAVAPTDLLEWVASADIVAMPIQPSTLNHRYTTPNKLFEAIATGVPVVASDLPGMADTVRDIDAGVLVDPTDVPAIVRGCIELLDLDEASRERRHTAMLKAAHSTYNWERQAEILLSEYSRITGRPW